MNAFDKFMDKLDDTLKLNRVVSTLIGFVWIFVGLYFSHRVNSFH